MAEFIKVGGQEYPATLIQNAYYTNNGETKVWMGEAGATADWSSSDFVSI